MLNRYWRSYHWLMQLLLFVLMVFICISLSQSIAFVLLPRLTGIELAELSKLEGNGSFAFVKAIFIFQVITALGLFLLPSLLFANLAHPRPGRYLGLVKPGKAVQPILAIIAMVAATPLFLSLMSLMQEIGLGAKADAAQKQNDELMKVFLGASSQVGIGVMLLVLAILPAVSEEIFFRGIFMRFIQKRSRAVVMPIAISSMAFAFAHASPYGFLPIFLAGIMLAAIYYLTGSLWCSMLGHMVYNGTQVVLEFYGRDNAYIKSVIESNSVPMPVVLAGAVISATAFYLLWKGRTPLPPDWAADYTKEELSQKAV